MGEALTTRYRRPPFLAGNFSNSAGSTSNTLASLPTILHDAILDDTFARLSAEYVCSGH